MTERRVRVAVLYGGRSSEHEISVLSGRSVIEALDRDRYDVVPVQIGRSGGWELEAAGALQLEPGAESRSLVPRPGASPVPAGAGPIDVVLPVLHGPFGEDGTVQGLLEMLDLPYVGSGVLGSAVTMDKEAVKLMLRGAEIPVARHVSFSHRRWDAERASSLGFPCFVKPANLGSSVGISKVHGPEELEAAMELAFRHDWLVLVEEMIDGREVELGVLGNADPIVSVPGEILIANDSEWYDFSAKYDEGGMQLGAPADLPAEVTADLQRTAARAFEICRCAGMARIDFFVTAEGGVVLNEINTIPGFTATSVYARLFEASGIPYRELLDRLIELALDRHRDERSYER
jgi:D-alanine-D-alanine ligase